MGQVFARYSRPCVRNQDAARRAFDAADLNLHFTAERGMLNCIFEEIDPELVELVFRCAHISNRNKIEHNRYDFIFAMAQ